ncbi:MAG: T9SS type A sorting domain-containing protein [Bacteroidota bacterium]
MKKMATFFLALVICSMELLAQPTITSGTGQIGFNVSSYGRLRGSSFPYVAANRELDRMSFVVAQADNAVFDYNEDGDSTSLVAQFLTIAGVDSAVTTMSDNGYTELPPKVKVEMTVMGWKNQKYLIVRYRVIADTAGLGSLYMGAVVVPRVGAAYGGEILKHNTAKKVTFMTRDATPSFWGFKVLGPNSVFGVRMMDWDEYSTDPDNEVTTDSMRNAMTKKSGFDTSLVAGANGSIFSVNVGKSAFTNKGDISTSYIAVAFAATEAEMYAAIDSATVKYPKIATSVQSSERMMPSGFALEQNYPNPFNPSTSIGFSVGSSSFVSMHLYDALGREIRSLVNQKLDAGTYSVTLNAKDLSSGVYYYTLQAGAFRSTKKMLLTK